MNNKTPNKAPFPSREAVLKFIRESPGKVGKREIARAFQLDTQQKIKLKALLKELEADGEVERGRGKRLAGPGSLPPVCVLEIVDTDIDGEVLARPLTWEHDAPPPTIYMAPERRGQKALGTGERVLARLTPIGDVDGRRAFEGRTIRKLTAAPTTTLGTLSIDAGSGQGRLKSTNRRLRDEYIVANAHLNDAEDGDLVLAEILPSKKLGLRAAKVLKRISRQGPESISLIAIHDYDLPTTFSEEALAQADKAKAAPLDKRDDLRDVALITIDGADARDFDDAVWAEPDDDPKNKGGWHIIVAIADVSWYVRPGDALDRGAFERGNSTYFPDRVVPMLPEALSNGWCSLRPHEDRPCMAAHLWIDADGHLKRHTFVRALMRSQARTTYEQVQAAMDGEPDDITTPLVNTVIKPLYGAYACLLNSRAERGVLELDLPERKIVLSDEGTVARVEPRERLESHKLIEEFMILANVAAAQTLEKIKQPCMYRIHDEPSREKLDALSEFLKSINIKLARGQVMKPATFNTILGRAKDTPNAHMVNEVVLRSQSQAQYDPENVGHFGLALQRYCHFTSPIRRYADLLVHRALIRGLKLGDGALEDDHRDFKELGEHISTTERRSASAERDAVDRFTASYLAEKVGATFKGRINGVTRFGLFVTLDDSGADGLVPIRTLPGDYYIHDEGRHALRGRSTRREFKLGESVDVVLMEADPMTGSMTMILKETAVFDENGLPFHADTPSPRRGEKRGKGKGGKKGAKSGNKKTGRSRAARRQKKS